MPNIFTWGFSELPLVIENGIEAGLLTGSAEIAYSADGVWSIESISLEGYRPTTSDERVSGKMFVRKLVTVKGDSPLHLMIVHRLEHEWRGEVQDAVSGQIEDDVASAPDNRADAIRAGRAA